MLTLSTDADFMSEFEQLVCKRLPVEFVSFTNPLDLIESFSKKYAQLVVLDLDLLKESAIKLVDILRSIRKNSRIILLLSQENTALCSQAFSHGVFAYQIKPVSPEAFCQLVESTVQFSQNHN